MRRLLLIANPAASGFTASLHRDVVEILESGFHVTAVWPNGPAQARSESASAAEDGFDVVAAMGGDGVMHEVANGIIGTDTALGIIPAGTTNVLRRVVGLPNKARDAAEALVAARGTRVLPTLAITEGSGSGQHSHVATFAAGVGFDAEVIRESERRPFSKVGFGMIHYARSALKVALSYRRRTPTLHVSDGRRSAEAVALMVQVHDHITYLGSVPLGLGTGPPPVAAVISRLTAPRLINIVTRAAAKRDPSRVPGVEIWHGFDQLEVTTATPMWLEADGELLGKTSAIRVRSETRELRVLDT